MAVKFLGLGVEEIFPIDLNSLFPLSKRVGHLLMKSELSQSTCRAYQTDFRAFVSYIESSYLGDDYIDRRAIQRFLEMQHQKGYAPETIARGLAGIRKVLGLLLEEGLIVNNPAQDIRWAARKEVQERRPVLLNSEQVRATLASAYTSTAIGVRNRAILTLIVFLDMKPSDIHRLNADHINIQTRYVKLSRRGVPEVKPIPEPATRSIRSWLAARSTFRLDEEALFISLDNAINAPGRSRRLSIRGIRKAVDKHLRLARAKKASLSCDSLRRSGAIIANNN